MYDTLCMHLVGLMREDVYNFYYCYISAITSHVQRYQLILHEERVISAFHSTTFKMVSPSDIMKMPCQSSVSI